MRRMFMDVCTFVKRKSPADSSNLSVNEKVITMYHCQKARCHRCVSLSIYVGKLEVVLGLPFLMVFRVRL